MQLTHGIYFELVLCSSTMTARVRWYLFVGAECHLMLLFVVWVSAVCLALPVPHPLLYRLL